MKTVKLTKAITLILCWIFIASIQAGGLTLEQAVAHGLDPSTIRNLDPQPEHDTKYADGTTGKVRVAAIANNKPTPTPAPDEASIQAAPDGKVVVE